MSSVGGPSGSKSEFTQEAAHLVNLSSYPTTTVLLASLPMIKENPSADTYTLIFHPYGGTTLTPQAHHPPDSRISVYLTLGRAHEHRPDLFEPQHAVFVTLISALNAHPA